MAEFKETEDRDVKLVSLDGDSFVVPLKVAKMSELVKTMMIDDDNSEEEKEIPLPNVKAATLAKVIEYCRHYIEEPMTEFEKPLKNADLYKLVQQFYAKFIVEMNNDDLFNLTLAANYMDIKPLLDLCSAKIASLIKDKTVEQIRVNLDIVNDFSPEEEAKVREENKWVDEL